MPIMHDFRCPCGTLFERMVAWNTERIRHDCGRLASRVFTSSRRSQAQPFDPVLVYRDRSGHIRFPGRSSGKVPKGYEPVYLKTTSQVRSFERQMNAKERERYMQSKEREARQFDPMISRSRSELRQKMHHFSPAGRELAEVAMRENDSSSSINMKFDAEFRLDAFSDDASNREPWNDRDARGPRK